MHKPLGNTGNAEAQSIHTHALIGPGGSNGRIALLGMAVGHSRYFSGSSADRSAQANRRFCPGPSAIVEHARAESEKVCAKRKRAPSGIAPSEGSVQM